MSEGSKPVRIGLLGRGTVGGAFAELLAERAGAVEAATGRRPQIAGVLTRSEGDFGEILERSDLVVELMGGTDPTRQLVLDALRAGRPVVTANKQLLAQHGDELFGVAREAGARRLAFTHHDPTRTDVEIDALITRYRGDAKTLDVFAAAEGLELDLFAAAPATPGRRCCSAPCLGPSGQSGRSPGRAAACTR